MAEIGFGFRPRALVRSKTVGSATQASQGEYVCSGSGPCVVFLDIDGVLHPLRKGSQSAFDSECMSHLRSVVASTGAKIVLSSSWRVAPRQKQRVHEALESAGLGGIMGATPVSGYNNNRVDEICAWLEQHPEVSAYVAIDDMDLQSGSGDVGSRSRIASSSVRTKPAEGLTASDASRAIEILRSSASGSGCEVRTLSVANLREYVALFLFCSQIIIVVGHLATKAEFAKTHRAADIWPETIFQKVCICGISVQ